MLTLPKAHDSLIQTFAPHFSNLVWQPAQVLLLGAILAPGRRTVTAVLRITQHLAVCAGVGLRGERQFQTYHRGLNRAAWSSWALSRTLLKWLVQTLVPAGPILCGLDDTLERRRGAQTPALASGASVKAKGLYRDPVRSSHGHLVKASGLRWLSLMLLAPTRTCGGAGVPWAHRTWALPFLTCLAPSERFYEKKARAHKKLTDWGRQTPAPASGAGVVMPLRRWWPERQRVTLAPAASAGVVADSSFAVIVWLFQLSQLPGPICLIVRFRLDAAWSEPAPEHRRPGQRGRTPKTGTRRPTMEQVAQNRKTKWKRVRFSDW